MVNSYTGDGDQKLALEEELAQVESAIHELMQKRAQLKCKINDLCPILKIPPEISLRIFMDVFPENSFSSWGKTTPLVFGAVCHNWRELAWSYPPLWSSVSFAVEHYSDLKNSLLQEWLTRSEDLPLSIYLRMREPRDDSGIVLNDMWKTTMDIIARCSERWQTVDFQLPMIFHPDICTVPTQFPLLVSLSICAVSVSLVYANFISDLNIHQIVWTTPKLQHIHIDHSIRKSLDFCISPSLEKTSFSWLGSSSPQRCLEILKYTPNLVEYKFRSMDNTLGQFPKVTASHLETLEFGFRPTNNRDQDPPWLSEFMNSLTIPAIRDLSISAGSSDVLLPPTAFISLISRSACHLLRRLSLSNMTAHEELAQCLSVIPSLTELLLKGMYLGYGILGHFTVDKASQKILLPDLESFAYIHPKYDWNSFDLKKLIKMATSRIKLNTIYIDFSRTIEVISSVAYGLEEARATFPRLITEGKDIQILGHNNANLLDPDVDPDV